MQETKTRSTPEPIRGAVPVLALPFFEDGSVDCDSLRREIDFCVEAGSQAIAFGMGSESHMLTDRERREVWSVAARHLAGRLPLIVATAHPSHEGVIELTRMGRDCGADVAMVNPESKTGDHLVELFHELSEEVDLSLMIQDAGGNAPVEVLLRAVREASRVSSLKIESVGTPDKIGRLIEGMEKSGLEESGRRITILGGMNGNLLLEELERGAVGTMPHPALIDAFRRVCDLYLAGERGSAWGEYVRTILRFNRLTPSGGKPGGDIWIHKAILQRAGILSSDRCRVPTEPQPSWIMEKIWSQLAAADLAITKRLA